MEYFSPALDRLVEQFARLPGVGSKSAQRLAFFVLSLPGQGRRRLCRCFGGRESVNPLLSRLSEFFRGGWPVPHL